MVTIYGLKPCDSCRRARSWLERSGIDYAFVDLRDQPPEELQIARWLERFGWQALLNRRSTTWRQLPESERLNIDAVRAAALLRQYPLLIKRPVLEGPDWVLGFDADRYAALFQLKPTE